MNLKTTEVWLAVSREAQYTISDIKLRRCGWLSLGKRNAWSAISNYGGVAGCLWGSPIHDQRYQTTGVWMAVSGEAQCTISDIKLRRCGWLSLGKPNTVTSVIKSCWFSQSAWLQTWPNQTMFKYKFCWCKTLYMSKQSCNNSIWHMLIKYYCYQGKYIAVFDLPTWYCIQTETHVVLCKNQETILPSKTCHSTHQVTMTGHSLDPHMPACRVNHKDICRYRDYRCM